MARRVKREKRSKRAKRRSTRRLRQRGGWQDMTPAKMSGEQGQEYMNIHKGQYGGGAAPPVLQGAPVGETGVLDPSLVPQARTGGTLASFQEIQGLSDQSGGGRRRRRGSNRRQRGGADVDLSTAADIDAPTHLLSGAQEIKAYTGQHPDWLTARNPTAYAPNSMKGGANAVPPAAPSAAAMPPMTPLPPMQPMPAMPPVPAMPPMPPMPAMPAASGTGVGTGSGTQKGGARRKSKKAKTKRRKTRSKKWWMF